MWPKFSSDLGYLAAGAAVRYLVFLRWHRCKSILVVSLFQQEVGEGVLTGCCIPKQRRHLRHQYSVRVPNKSAKVGSCRGWAETYLAIIIGALLLVRKVDSKLSAHDFIFVQIADS